MMRYACAYFIYNKHTYIYRCIDTQRERNANEHPALKLCKKKYSQSKVLKGLTQTLTSRK